MSRRAVYTALIGGYEELAEQDVDNPTGVDLICLTDDPDLRSTTWRVIQVGPLLPLDPIRSARQLKIEGHRELCDYDETLWIDARVQLRRDPAQILDAWLADADVAMPVHSFRENVIAEFEAVLQIGLDDSSRVYEQLRHYAAVAPQRLLGPVPWTALVARRHTDQTARAMREWMMHVLRYSRRDQLSVAEALARQDVAVNLIAFDNFESDVHAWLNPVGRSTRHVSSVVGEFLQPPIAEVGELQLQLDAARAANAEQAARAESQQADLTAQIEGLRVELAAQSARATRLTARNAKLRGANDKLVDALRPGPIRRLGRRVRRLMGRRDRPADLS